MGVRRRAIFACVGLAAVLIGLVSWMQGVLAQVPTVVAPAADPRRSGFDYMGPALQAMQRDDAQNPGMLWVKQGQALWQQPAGASARSCQSCHGEASSMRGVAASFPRWSEALARPLSLGQQIERCRRTRQQAAAQPAESEERLALETLVAYQSRGLPLAPPVDARLEPWLSRGMAQYRQRIGQLNLSCAQCHDEQPGRSLGGSLIPQGHASGYPTYRLQWQTLGSLPRRLRACFAGVRAEIPPYDAPELLELEIYLSRRSSGMRIETPALRP